MNILPEIFDFENVKILCEALIFSFNMLNLSSQANDLFHKESVALAC